MRPALVGLCAVALIACGGARAAAPATSESPEDAPLEIVRAGVAMPLAPDAPIAIASDMTATIHVVSVPGIRAMRMLRLELSDDSGPVPAAVVLVTGHMRFMDHGSFQVAATASGDGRFTVVLPFVMSGEWELVITAETTAVKGGLILDLSNYD